MADGRLSSTPATPAQQVAAGLAEPLVPPRAAGPVSELLGQACDSLAARPDFRELHRGKSPHLADMSDQCRQPLRVAVTGDVSSGKSTLVNAFLGACHAEVRWEETTAEVTWYRHPALPPPSALIGGEKHHSVSFPMADRIILADTPGVNTASGNQRMTDAMLAGGTRTASLATVLLYLCGAEVNRGAKDRLSQFAELTTGDLGSGFNVILVGSKADEVDADPVDIERNIQSQAALAGALAVAVSQQLALAARTDAIGQHHLDALRTIASDEALTLMAGYGWDSLAAMWQDRGHDPGAIRELQDLSGTVFGVSRALPPVAGGEITAVAGLADFWLGISGLERLEAVLDRLTRYADVLTVNAVTARLRRFGADLGPGRAAVIREELAQLRRRPEFEQLERQAAALVIESPVFAYLSERHRSAAVRLLHGEQYPHEYAEMARFWREHAAQPGRPARVSYVANLVADVAIEGLRDWRRPTGTET